MSGIDGAKEMDHQMKACDCMKENIRDPGKERDPLGVTEQIGGREQD